MARRITRAQLASQLRRSQQKRRQAVNKHNSAVRNLNRAVDKYNREAKAHNARVRANRSRLQRELSRLKSSPPRVQRTTYHRSVVTLQQSFSRMEASAEAGGWTGSDILFDLSEGEAANSVAVLNALLAEPAGETADDYPELQSTSITHELSEISPDLDARWSGALFALDPRNPDAARHFCTSAREVLTAILESEAPDNAVIEADPQAPRTPDGRVTRRARIRYCLDRRGTHDPDLEGFVDADLDNVLVLFRDFNDGTHGRAGRFGIAQLAAIKKRVEDAIHFLYRIVR